MPQFVGSGSGRGKGSGCGPAPPVHSSGSSKNAAAAAHASSTSAHPIPIPIVGPAMTHAAPQLCGGDGAGVVFGAGLAVGGAVTGAFFAGTITGSRIVLAGVMTGSRVALVGVMTGSRVACWTGAALGGARADFTAEASDLHPGITHTAAPAPTRALAAPVASLTRQLALRHRPCPVGSVPVKGLSAA